MPNNTGTYSYFQVMASGANYSIPMPTAYGYPSDHIIVLDGLSAVYTATAGGATSLGGLFRTNVKVNGTGAANIVAGLTSDIYCASTGVGSGLNVGGINWEPNGGFPLQAGGAGTATTPGVPATSNRIDFTFTGSPTAGNVELCVRWHYESPSERR